MNIQTYFANPPIPVRSFDWQAYVDGYEPGYEPGDALGHGDTEAEAVADLLAVLGVAA